MNRSTHPPVEADSSPPLPRGPAPRRARRWWNPFWLCGLGLWLAAPANAEMNENHTRVYGAAEIARLQAEGLPAPGGGTWHVWTWSPRGSRVVVTVAGRELAGQVPGRAEEGRTFDWVNLGTVDLQSGTTLKIARAPAPEPAPIGYLALSTDPGYHPLRALELRRARPFTDAPVPDARATRARTNQEGVNFQPFTDREAWLQRRQQVREQILVSCGLYPLPERQPLEAQVYGKLVRDGYTIEKVVLKTLPDFYLTGNLYRPAAREGKLPGILCPHGHWATGRFEEQVQARCIGLARMGGVVFVYDMVGYADSRPFGHSFRNDARELLGLNLTGLQLWNSIRALDFLAGLPDVDATRIACTGASGGGTQTFLLGAVDDRVSLSAPVCMVSHTFQGGCECENSPALRYDTDNVEIAACFAPRPMILVGATGDWTSKLMTNGYPEIRSTYRLLGREENVSAVVFNAGHNYNKDSREAVYAWFGRHLFGITDPQATREKPYQVEKPETISCWDAEHPRPSSAASPAALQQTLDRMVGEQVARLTSVDSPDWAANREMLRRALQAQLGCAAPAPDDLLVEELGTTFRKGYQARRLLIGRRGRGDQVPSILYLPAGRRPEYGVVVVHPQGKAELVMDDGEPGELVASLLRSGEAVLAIDAFLTGEHVALREPSQRATAPHFLTYNRSTLAERVQDILTAAAYLRGLAGMQGVHLAGLQSAGPWCLLARPLTSDVSRLVADASQFEFSPSMPATDEMYSPGALRCGGLRTAAALVAPRRMLVHNTGNALDMSICRRGYTRDGALADLQALPAAATVEEIVAWLTR
jgi:dienelactone hydrolase